MVGGPGREFWVFGTNYSNNVPASRMARGSMELGAWRLELSPRTAAEKDLFLNVLQVTDRNAKTRWPVKPITTRGRVGCLVEAPETTWAVLWGRHGVSDEEQVIINVPGSGDVRVLVADLTPGKWQARRDGSVQAQPIEVSKESGVAWFRGRPGRWSLAK